MGEGSIGWSHGDENVREHANPPPVIPRGIRRVAEEIIATGKFSSINIDCI
jgi:hypothetical protein